MSTTLNWSAFQREQVTIQPLGSVATSGSSRAWKRCRTEPAPAPSIENVTYTLTATNACGGTATRTATAARRRLDRSRAARDACEPLLSHGLSRTAASQSGTGLQREETLDEGRATAFKNNEQYDQDKQADGRRTCRHPRARRNTIMALSERRAEAGEELLVSQGIPADKIETRAEGKDTQLTEQQVDESSIARSAAATKMDDEQEEGDLARIQPPRGHHS